MYMVHLCKCDSIAESIKENLNPFQKIITNPSKHAEFFLKILAAF